jgi:hypothetical protein
MSFVNPNKPLAPGRSVNDGLSMAAIVLLSEGRLPVNEHDEVSHLCGMPRCVNVAHLCWEPMSTNFARNECQHYAQTCTHTPPCIIVDKHERERAYQVFIAETLGVQAGVDAAK